MTARNVIRNTALPMMSRAVRRPVDGDMNHVLVIQPDHLGDILLSQPAVRSIRHQFPDARLTAVVGPWSIEAARLAWDVDDVVDVTFPGFVRGHASSLLSPYAHLRNESKRLARLNAGVAFVLRPDAWWAAWLAAGIAPEVWGSDDPRVRPFVTHVQWVAPSQHAVLRAWQIATMDAKLNQVPAPTTESHPLRLEPAGGALDAANALMDRSGVRTPYVVLHPGSGAPVKEWPEARWGAVGSVLSQQGISAVITGTAAEREHSTRIEAMIPGSISLAGQTDLPVLVALLSQAALVIGPDCGPLHVAVGTGTRSIHLFGPSDPKRYGPWGNESRHRVISSGMKCSRCGDLSPQRVQPCGCMLAISTTDVFVAATEMLADVRR